jgi:translocation and assembly module TamA
MRFLRIMSGARLRLLALGWVGLFGLVCAVPPAFAFDLFGFFGSDAPPTPSAATLPYDVEFETIGSDDVESFLEDTSGLYRLRSTPPPDGQSLVQRVRADFAPLIDTLWGAGYYNARVIILVAGVPLELGREGDEAAARAASAYRNRATVPVRIRAETGLQFKLRSILVLDSRSGQPLFDLEQQSRILKLEPGDPARSSEIRAANARLIDLFRNQAHPLAKVQLPAPVVDHALQSVDIAFVAEPGPVAGIGHVALTGPTTFDSRIMRSFIYLEPGEPYSPKALDDTRRSIASIPAVGSVRIREAERLDASGNLPLFAEVADRAPNLAGFSVGYSTLDGPRSRVYYENRNLAGGAERLRLEGDLFLAPRNDGTQIESIGDFERSDLGGRVSATFLKPALNGTHWDLLVDAVAERNRTGGGRFGGYTYRDAGGTAGFRYRIDETLSVQGGLKYEIGQTSDVLGQVDYRLTGLPLTVRYDTTDRPLDPSRGVRLTGTVTPYPTFLGSSVSFTRITANGSAYYALDSEANYILAGRVGFGTLLGGPDFEDIPANYRFYAGGVGSIRGYRSQTVGPSGPFGFTVGGRSLFDASLEARIKVTDSIGVAPFVDVGGAYIGTTPFSDGDTRASAGLGLLYYTGIGPIRLDVAAPLNPRPGDKPVAVYVSIGQSF